MNKHTEWKERVARWNSPEIQVHLIPLMDDLTYGELAYQPFGYMFTRLILSFPATLYHNAYGATNLGRVLYCNILVELEHKASWYDNKGSLKQQKRLDELFSRCPLGFDDYSIKGYLLQIPEGMPLSLSKTDEIFEYLKSSAFAEALSSLKNC